MQTRTLKHTQVGMIDAHAGGLGCIGAGAGAPSSPLEDLRGRMALICGTSTCHMAVVERKIVVPGVWGPFYGAMVPGMWLAEGGCVVVGVGEGVCVWVRVGVCSVGCPWC